MNFEPIELPRYNGWVNYPTWSMFTWLSDQTEFPQAVNMSAEQLCKLVQFSLGGKPVNRGHMFNATSMNNGYSRSVEVGRDLLYQTVKMVDWSNVAFMINPEINNDAPTQLPDLMPNPTVIVERYFNISNTGRSNSTTQRAWSYIVGSLASRRMNCLDAALKDYVEDKLWGDHVPANPATESASPC